MAKGRIGYFKKRGKGPEKIEISLRFEGSKIKEQSVVSFVRLILGSRIQASRTILRFYSTRSI